MNTVAARSGFSPNIDSVDWNHVRPVYKKLHDDFFRITEPFGIIISPATNLHLSHLIAAFDSIDRNLDRLTSFSDRKRFAATIISSLANDTEIFESKLVSAEVSRRIENLRRTLQQRNIKTGFCRTAARIFEHAEAKRSTTSPRRMIAAMREEWRLTGHLTVLVLGRQSTSAFNRFFYLLCEMMTAVDMIQDAQSDYRSGQISVRPSLSLYTRLLGEFLLPMPRLVWRFPKPLQLFAYTISFLIAVYWPWNTKYTFTTRGKPAN